MAVEPYALFGAGKIIDKTNETSYLGYGRIGVNFETSMVEIPKGNWNLTTIRKALRGGISGTASWHYSSANQLGILTGATATAGTGISVAKEETHTVPGAPYQVTVTNSGTYVAGTIGDNSVYSVTALTGAKTWYEKVGAGSEATGKFSEASGVLTFHSSDTTKVVYIDYLYTNATGSYTTIDPTDTPAKWVGYFVIEGVRETTGASDHVTFVALKAEWTGNFTLGADREGHEAISRDFFINNDAVGDIKVYFG